MDDPRFADFVKSIGVDAAAGITKGVVICGHADDDGVRINKGRVGAKDGPQAIRKSLARLCAFKGALPIYDVGDLSLGGDLPAKQLQAIDTLSGWSKDIVPVTLGGGHDWAYVDGACFLKRWANKKRKPVIINLDAHLDVRPNGPHSGSPFFQLLEEFSNFTLIQVGIQLHVNATAHLEYCAKKKISVITMEDIGKASALVAKKLVGSPDCFLSVDIDGFSSAIAPGCSAPNPGGLMWADFESLFKTISKRSRLRALGIYEVNPLYDRDNQTARLAATIVHKLWRHLSWKD